MVRKIGLGGGWDWMGGLCELSVGVDQRHFLSRELVFCLVLKFGVNQFSDLKRLKRELKLMSMFG